MSLTPAAERFWKWDVFPGQQRGENGVRARVRAQQCVYPPRAGRDADPMVLGDLSAPGNDF